MPFSDALCQLLCSPLAAGLQIFGTFWTMAVVYGWMNCGTARQSELSRRSDGGRRPRRAMSGDSASPGVSVVMPVKGCRPHSMSNWMSQVNMQYNGPLEFLFVVESEDDAAFGALRELQRREGWRGVSLLVAGQSSMCSQKIHNQLAGVERANPEHKYLFFLDDDVQLHPSTLEDLVAVLEDDPSLFMATGYPFDLVPADGSVFSHAIAAYHHILTIGATAMEQHMFIWGGCMLLPLRCIQDDGYGIRSAWRHGGYSDDLILVTTCKEYGLKAICPYFAVFPQRLHRCGFPEFWNYLHRQLFVMDTYRNRMGMLINWCCASLLALLGVSMSVPALQAAVRAGLWATTGRSSCCGNGLDLLPQLWVALWLAASIAFWRQLRLLAALFTLLSPKRDHGIPRFTVGYFLKFWAGFYMCWGMITVVAAYSFWHAEITWSGVRYRKQGGAVRRVMK